MYSWIWRKLPGGLPGKVIGSLVLAALVVALLFLYVFPWIEPRLPVGDVTVDSMQASPHLAALDAHSTIPLVRP